MIFHSHIRSRLEAWWNMCLIGVSRITYRLLLDFPKHVKFSESWWFTRLKIPVTVMMVSTPVKPMWYVVRRFMVNSLPINLNQSNAISLPIPFFLSCFPILLLYLHFICPYRIHRSWWKFPPKKSPLLPGAQLAGIPSLSSNLLGGSSHLVSGLVHPNYKWLNPTYPIYNWGCNPLTKWDEPPSSGDV